MFSKELVPALDERGVGFAQWADLSAEDRAYLDDLFAERIFPVLTPLAVDPAHPFPYISNLSLNLAVTVRDSATGRAALRPRQGPAAAPALPRAPRRAALRAARTAHRGEARRAVPGDGSARALPVPGHARHRLRARRRSRGSPRGGRVRLAPAQPVRPGRAPRGRQHHERETLALLCRELELSEADVTTIDGPLDLVALWALYSLDRPDLKDEVWVPQTQAALAGGETAPDFFRLLQTSDVLVHHPVRLVHHVGRAVRRAGRERQCGPRDQADHLPHRRSRERDRPLAHQGRRAGHSGRRPRRAHRTVRRAGQHRTCPRARRSGRARGVRARRAQDARQGAARRAPRSRRHPALLPHRHGQLQRQDREHLRRPRACSRPTPTSAPTSPTSSTTSPATAIRSSTASCSSRRRTCAKSCSTASRVKRRRARAVASR